MQRGPEAVLIPGESCRFDWSLRLKSRPDPLITAMHFDVPAGVQIVGEAIEGHTTAVFIDGPRGHYEIKASIDWVSRDGAAFGTERFTADIRLNPAS